MFCDNYVIYPSALQSLTQYTERKLYYLYFTGAEIDNDSGIDRYRTSARVGIEVRGAYDLVVKKDTSPRIRSTVIPTLLIAKYNKGMYIEK